MKIILKVLTILALLLILLIVGAASYSLGRRGEFLQERSETLQQHAVVAFEIRSGHPDEVLKLAEAEMDVDVLRIEIYRQWPGIDIEALDSWDDFLHPERVRNSTAQALAFARTYVSHYKSSAFSPDVVAFLNAEAAK